ncbi:MAG: glycosyltransferase family 2 protein [Planctomycetes bacterium]|nr:glycosyltransferase family 2 protein [Planctomycetota bacterium]
MPGGDIELSLVIPAYNEAARLPAFLDSVLAYLPTLGLAHEIIVVDDGSGDATSAEVRRRQSDHPQLRLLRHASNAGKGAAVRTGMLAATGRQRLFADADGATAIHELPHLRAAASAGAAIAIASREGGNKVVKVSGMRKFLGRWFNRVVRLGAVKGLRDTQCGFKLYASPQAHALFSLAQEDGYAFDVEVLFLAQRKGLQVAEVPVDWTEMPGSKVSVWRDGMKMLRAVRRVKRRWRRGGYEAPAPRHTPLSEPA